MAIMLLGLCMFSAFAAGDSIKISTKSEADYQLSFPASTEIPWEAQSTPIGEVKATKMLIEPGKAVKVSVSSENGYQLVNALSDKSVLTYTLAGAENMAFLPGDIGKAFPLTVEIAPDQWAKAASGEHSDILTFTAEYSPV